jgi:hypothetical protein
VGDTACRHAVIASFQIRVDDSVLADLQRRLAQTRSPDQLEDTGWDYRMPVE